MKIVPWKKNNGDLAVRGDFDDWMDPFMEALELPFKSRLGELFQTHRYPLMNVSETENHFLLTLELPGLDAKDVNIELMGNQLIISGERKWEEEKKGKEFHRVESRYGAFTRNVYLPDSLRLEREAIEATFEKGMLEIRVPKLQPTPAAKIPVKTRK